MSNLKKNLVLVKRICKQIIRITLKFTTNIINGSTIILHEKAFNYKLAFIIMLIA